MRRTLAFLLGFLLLVTSVPALAEGTESNPLVVASATAMQGKFFTGMWGNNTSDIDVRTMLHAYSPVVWTMQSLFEANMNVVQNITAGTLDNGNKLYTVTLQTDLTYNDGTPITAADYLFSIMLQASPVVNELGGNTTSVFYIDGYEEYASGSSEVFAGLGLVDEYTYVVEINKDYLPFFYELGMLDFGPYPISVIAPGCEVVDEGKGAFIRNVDTSVTEPIFNKTLLEKTIMDPTTGYMSNPKVTSGPYQLTEYNATEHTATFKINTYFKGDYTGQKPTIQSVKYINVTPDNMAEEYSSGRVQLLNKVVAGETIAEGLAFVADGTATSSSYPRMGFGFIAFSCEQGPAQFEAVRKAVAYSFSVEEFCERYTTLNYALPVYGYYGVGQWMTQMLLNPGTQPQDKTAEQEAEWASLTLDGLNQYEPDIETAKKLLVDDGWTLNANGDPFTDGQDTVRYKNVDGQLMGLTLRYGKTKDSIGAEILLELIQEPLKSMGIELVVTELSFDEVMRQYYREETRTFDMFHLATNFLSVFDPYMTFNTDEDFIGTQNTTGYRDEKLEALALDLRKTEPNDLLTYCKKWLSFQTYFNETLPMIPLYSNVYFDFFIPDLQQYYPNAQMNWPAALLYGYIGAAAEGYQASDGSEVAMMD